LYNPAPSQTPPPQIRKSLAQGVLDSEPATGTTTGFGNLASSAAATHVPDLTYPEQRQSEQTSPVLLVDASGHHKSPDLAEVPVVTGIIQSPVRVVCHSPRSVGRNRLENSVTVQRSDDRTNVTGHLETGRKVKVSSVPSVNILNSSTRKKDASPGHVNSDNLASEHFTGEGPSNLEMHDTEGRKESKQKRETVDQFKSFLGEEGYHAPPLSSNLSTSEIKQQLFDFSLDSHSQAGDGDESKLPSDEKQNLKLKKKKQKTARIVPSRYMEKAKVTKKVPAKEVPLPTKKKVKAPSATSKSKDQSLLHPGQSNDSTLNLDVITPFIRHTSQQKGIVTSTPADGLVSVEPPPHMAAPTPILPQGIATSTRVQGAVGGAGAVKKTPRDKIKTQALVSKKQVIRTTGPSQAAVQAPHVMAKPPLPTEGAGHTSSEETDVSQRQLELQYSRVVQAAFLYSRLKHSFAQKEKDAQTQMYAVWQEREKLQREVANLELQLKMKTKIAELNQQIQLQMSGLKPIGSNMLKLILEFSKLAAALDTTRHHMSVNGVFIPANHDELFAVLDESERLLGEIDELTKQKQPKVHSFASEMEGLSKTVESEIQEQKRCGELLAAASTLSTQERSLQAQCIMAGE